MLTRRLFNLLDLGVDGEADLASYLLFDGPFCRRLIEMGRSDAQARRDELVALSEGYKRIAGYSKDALRG